MPYVSRPVFRQGPGRVAGVQQLILARIAKSHNIPHLRRRNQGADDVAYRQRCQPEKVSLPMRLQRLLADKYRCVGLGKKDAPILRRAIRIDTDLQHV